MFLGLGLLAVLASVPAGATVPDKYGSGARSMGSGGGGVAWIDDGASARLNPAGLAWIRQPTAAVGFSAAMERFDAYPQLWWDTNRDGVVDERDAPLHYPSDVDDAYGMHLSAGRNVGGKFGIGASVYTPVDRLIRYKTFEPALPSYFMYDNRTQRYVLAVGLGGEIAPGIAVGLAVDVLAAARAKVWMTVDATVTGDPEGDELEDSIGELRIDVHEIELDLVPIAAPIVGVQVDMGKLAPKLDGLRLGGSFRAGAGLPIEAVLDIQANVALEDFGDLDPFISAVILDAGLDLFDHYSPPVANIGVAWRNAGAFSAYADARWTGWRGMTANVARISSAEVTSPLVQFDDLIIDGNAHDMVLRDVVSVRAGTELRLPRVEFDTSWEYLQLTIRGGWGFEPSPLMNQGTTSALLDADRTLYTAGAGVEFFDPLALVDAPVRADLLFQYHALANGFLPRHAEEPTAGYPVDAERIPIGGRVLVFGGQVGFDY